MRLFCIALLLFSVVGGAGSAFAQTPVSEPERVLRPGDQVKISVWRKPELSGEFSIAADGALADPFYSAVSVGGVSLAVATQRIREYIERIEANPRVWVEPLFRVTVGGEVRTPNLYSFPRETTISQAVALAGGASTQGRMDRVTLIRDGRGELIDLTDPATPWANSVVHSGDQILVGRRTSILREYLAPASSVIAAVGVVVNVLRK